MQKPNAYISFWSFIRFVNIAVILLSVPCSRGFQISINPTLAPSSSILSSTEQDKHHFQCKQGKTIYSPTSLSQNSPKKSNRNSRFRLHNSNTQNFGTQRDEAWYKRSKKWILLVDDEESIRQAVGQYLYDQGYQVTACADAETALNVCLSKQNNEGEKEEDEGEGESKNVPDAIISDICMPPKHPKNIQDGIELVKIIRSNPNLVSIPVIFLTAKGSTKDRIAGYNAGADGYLPKPFDPEELLTMIDNAIARHDNLNQDEVTVGELQQDLKDIKELLLKQGGGGIGNGWIKATNVFLTPMERDVLTKLCEGKMNKEIAGETYLSKRRVEQLLTSMFKKTGSSNRTELVRWAVSTGLADI